MNKKHNRKVALFLIPGFLGVLVFFLVPLCICLYFSFGAGSAFGNYDKVLQSQAFRLAVRNTLRLIVFGLPVILASTTPMVLFPAPGIPISIMFFIAFPLEFQMR